MDNQGIISELGRYGPLFVRNWVSRVLRAGRLWCLTKHPSFQIHRTRNSVPEPQFTRYTTFQIFQTRNGVPRSQFTRNASFQIYQTRNGVPGSQFTRYTSFQNKSKFTR